MNPSDKCRVDDCDRRAAASIIRDNFPGPLPLCATHTEDFRLNGAAWVVTWDQMMAEPTSVKAAQPSQVGRDSPGPAITLASKGLPANRFRSRLAPWRRSRS